MDRLKALRFPVLGVLLTFAVIAAMGAVAGDHPPDGVLIGFSLAACMALLGWALCDAPAMPQQWLSVFMMPAMAVGMVLLLGVSDRYPPFWPFTVGAAATVAFVAVGLLAHWRPVGWHSHFTGAEFEPGKVCNPFECAAILTFAGIFVFQPMVLLLNGQGNSRPPVVLEGKVARLYETHGKGAAPYVVFSGPAGAVGSTFTPGEFKLDWADYHRMYVGQRNCVTLHEGLLRFSWWSIGDCGRYAAIATLGELARRGKFRALIEQMEALVRRDPQAMDEVNESWIEAIFSSPGLLPQGTLHERMLAVLATPAYKPELNGAKIDFFRYDYAVLQSARGDTAGAARTFAAITDARLLMRASLDPRLRGIAPTHLDARAAVERQIAGLRKRLDAHPGHLPLSVQLARAYLYLDDAASAIAVLEPVRPDGPLTVHNPALSDDINWWRVRANAHAIQGHYDQASASLRSALVTDGPLGRRTPQLLDVASVQSQFGHPAQALATLAPLGQNPAGWGMFQIANLRALHGCASYASGQREAADADVAWLREHADMLPGMLNTALLCTHADDEVASRLIQSMGRPAEIAGARLMVSHYAPAPATSPQDPFMAGVVRIMARADVQAALNRAGGAGNFNVPHW